MTPWPASCFERAGFDFEGDVDVDPVESVSEAPSTSSLRGRYCSFPRELEFIGLSEYPHRPLRPNGDIYPTSRSNREKSSSLTTAKASSASRFLLRTSVCKVGPSPLVVPLFARPLSRARSVPSASGWRKEFFTDSDEIEPEAAIGLAAVLQDVTPASQSSCCSSRTNSVSRTSTRQSFERSMASTRDLAVALISAFIRAFLLKMRLHGPLLKIFPTLPDRCTATRLCAVPVDMPPLMSSSMYWC